MRRYLDSDLSRMIYHPYVEFTEEAAATAGSSCRELSKY